MSLSSTIISTQTEARTHVEFTGFGGRTDATADNNALLNAFVLTAPDSQVSAGPRTAGQAGLEALFVDTNVIATNPEIPFSIRRAIDTGMDHFEGTLTKFSAVEWLGDVHLLGGTAELDVGAFGDIGVINKATNVTVNGGQSSGLILGPEIVVDDIRNTGGGGRVLIDTHGGQILGSGGTWTFSDTLSHVRLTNNSDKLLTVKNIGLLGNGAPSVELRAEAGKTTLQFDLRRTTDATEIDISGVSDVYLTGVIDNPIGQTNITSQTQHVITTQTGFVRTRGLDVAAARDIGAIDVPFRVELVQGTENPTFTAIARENAYLSLAGLIRGAGDLFHGQLGPITAVRDLDILMLPSTREDVAGRLAGGVLVTVPNDPYAQTLFRHFRPDGLGGPAPFAGAFFGNPASGVSIPTVFDFSLLQADRNITLNSAGQFPITVIAQLDSEPAGRIDAVTTGNIVLAEVGGAGMSLGTVRSTGGSIVISNRDHAGGRPQNVVLLPGGVVSAATDAFIGVGDDLVTAPDSVLEAGTSFIIHGDYFDADPLGSTLSLAGSLSSPTTILKGGDDPDTFNVASGPVSGRLQVDGDPPTDAPGDVLNFDAQNRNVTLDGNTITASNRGPVEYTEIERVNLANVGGLTVNGTTGNDVLRLFVEPGVSGGFVLNNRPFITLGNSDFFIFNGKEGDDRMVVDLTNGSPIPIFGVRFHGGPDAGGGDAVEVNGDGDDFALLNPDSAIGVLQVLAKGTVVFDGAERVAVSGMGSLTVTTPGSADVIDVGSFFVSQIITGTSGGVAITPVIFYSDGEVILDTGANDGASPDDRVTLTGGLVGLGLKTFVVKTGAGDDVLAVRSAIYATPGSGSGFRFEGGTGTDFFAGTGDVSYTLADAGVTSSGGGTVAFDSVEGANLTDGASDNTFDVSGWTRAATLNGAGNSLGDKVVSTNDADFVLGNFQLSRSDGAIFSLFGISLADLAGGAGDNRFTVSGWNLSARLDGRGGNDTVVSSNDADFDLNDGQLTRSTFGTFDLASIERAELTGGASANTFRVQGYSGIATLDGDDAGDSFDVTFRGTGAGSVEIVDTGTTGTDTASVTGTTGADALVINPTGVTRGSESVTYTAALEELAVSGLAGADSFSITPSVSTAVHVDGDADGDRLTVELAGAADPMLSVSATPDGLTGAFTFGDRRTVNFREIETLGNAVDLRVTKSDGQAAAIPGTGATYTVTVSNNGPLGLTGVSVRDVIPTILAGARYSSVTSGGASGNTVDATGDIADTVDLPVGSSIVYTVTGTIDPGALGTLANTATLTLPPGVTDSNAPDNSATDSDELVPHADLSVVVSDLPDPVVAGTELTYTITVHRAGPSDARNVTLADVLPAGTTFVSFAAPAGWVSVTPNVGGTGPLTATRASLAAGAADQVFTLVVRVNPDTPAVSHTVTVRSDAVDLNSGDNAATEATEVDFVVDLSVTLDDGFTVVTAGDPLVYTIVVRNTGPSTAVAAPLMDTLPANFVSVTWTSSATGGATGNSLAGAENINETLTLPPGSVVTYTLTGTVSEASGRTLVHAAAVAPNAETTDTDPANDQAADTDTVLPRVTITASDPGAMEATADQTANPGAFTVTRNGDLATPLTVFYTIGGTAVTGTDYTIQSGSVVFGVNVASVVIPVVVLNDLDTEGDETVMLTLTPDASYTVGAPGGAAVTIADNEAEVSVTTLDGSAAERGVREAPDPGRFQLFRTGDLSRALTVSYVVEGTAANGADYDLLSGRATFAAGSATVVIDVNVRNDSRAEGPKLVRIRLVGGTGYTVTAAAAEVTIADNETGLPDTVPAGNVRSILALDVGNGRVRVLDATTHAELLDFHPYPGFFGAVELAVADVNRDGTPDVITGSGSSASHVKVFDTRTGAELYSFYAFPGFTGGVYVGGGDVDGDGFSDVIVGAGAGGGPHVKVFSGRGGRELYSFFAYSPTFGGGVHVAAGDVDGDGRADVITGTATGAPHVKVMDAGRLSEVRPDGVIGEAALLASFYAFAPTFTGGVTVAGGDFNGDGAADVIVGAGPGGGPHVKVIDAARLDQVGPTGEISESALRASYFGFDDGVTGGVWVDGLGPNGDGLTDVLARAGQGAGGRVRRFAAADLALLDELTVEG
ncbi:MAG TPA: Calx-beta domain-containing protein [Urbifossiella sp.]|nr:Calx-beta domain-containing protein [Urbifossiella sp.]